MCVMNELTDRQHQDINLLVTFYLLCSAHPYLFFNDDGGSVTFVGFKLSETGDLLHPTASKCVVLKSSIATVDLMKDLQHYGVDLNEEWDKWLV